ncbi:MAG: ABC transporter permease subunit [candidate division FCPU426 bacterium]
MALTKISITKELRGFGTADLLVILILVGMLGGLLAVGQQWVSPFHAAVQIDLSPWALIGYCASSLARNFAAFLVSLAVAFWWGIWAAKSRAAEKILIPLVDILQAIPVLGFMPGLVLGLVHLFPHSRIGLELACVLMIVTSQAWNMILSVYQSVKGIPTPMRDMADNAGLSRRQRFLHLELPFSMTPLVWNCMLSVGNGWFFVTVTEAFVLGSQDFRLPGIGSYMSVAMETGNMRAMVYGVTAMAVMVVALDQLLWRPLVVWADRFRTDDQAPMDPLSSPVLRFFLGSKFLIRLGDRVYALVRSNDGGHGKPTPRRRIGVEPASLGARLQSVLGVAFLGVLALGAWRMLAFFHEISLQRWGAVLGEAGLTLCRILVAMLLCAVWAIPLGVKIGLNQRLAKYLQPVIQLFNSYPAPLLFPALLAGFLYFGWDIEVSSVLLMMVGTFAYLLFNVIGGASLISQEQKDVWACYGPSSLAYWKKFIFPAILPSLVVGLNTMMGAAWNATIVTEFVRLRGQDHVVKHGLGATINLATDSGDLALLTAAVFVMAALVVAINRVFWSPLSDYAARLSA